MTSRWITFNIWCVPKLVGVGLRRSTCTVHATAQEWLRQQGCRVLNFMPADQDLSTFKLPKGYGKVLLTLLTRALKRVVAHGLWHAVCHIPTQENRNLCRTDLFVDKCIPSHALPLAFLVLGQEFRTHAFGLF